MTKYNGGYDNDERNSRHNDSSNGIAGQIKHRYDKHSRGKSKAGLYLYFACLYDYYYYGACHEEIQFPLLAYYKPSLLGSCMALFQLHLALFRHQYYNCVYIAALQPHLALQSSLSQSQEQ